MWTVCFHTWVNWWQPQLLIVKKKLVSSELRSFWIYWGLLVGLYSFLVSLNSYSMLLLSSICLSSFCLCFFPSALHFVFSFRLSFLMSFSFFYFSLSPFPSFSISFYDFSSLCFLLSFLTAFHLSSFRHHLFLLSFLLSFFISFLFFLFPSFCSIYFLPFLFVSVCLFFSILHCFCFLSFITMLNTFIDSYLVSSRHFVCSFLSIYSFLCFLLFFDSFSDFCPFSSPALLYVTVHTILWANRWLKYFFYC